jgi:hypothetical protein
MNAWAAIFLFCFSFAASAGELKERQVTSDKAMAQIPDRNIADAGYWKDLEDWAFRHVGIHPYSRVDRTDDQATSRCAAYAIGHVQKGALHHHQPGCSGAQPAKGVGFENTRRPRRRLIAMQSEMKGEGTS